MRGGRHGRREARARACFNRPGVLARTLFTSIAWYYAGISSRRLFSNSKALTSDTTARSQYIPTSKCQLIKLYGFVSSRKAQAL